MKNWKSIKEFLKRNGSDIKQRKRFKKCYKKTKDITLCSKFFKPLGIWFDDRSGKKPNSIALAEACYSEDSMFLLKEFKHKLSQ